MTTLPAPKGFTLVHTAEFPELADLLRDVLVGEGYTVYETDNDSGGLFRTAWGSQIFVRDDQADSARTALEAYMHAEEYQTRSREIQKPQP